MSATVTRLSGDDWQAWADQLLSLRYGPGQYQKVPAKDSGDAGIEGFSLCGHAYQAYGVLEPLSTKERYEKQRNKMTTDVAKFIANSAKLQSLLGQIKVCRWCLFVPHFDSKELVVHATKKTDEITAASLSYITNDFRVMVCDEDEFAVERQTLLNANVGAIDLQCLDITDVNIAEWAEDNDVLVATLDGKVVKLPTLSSPTHRRKFRDKIIKHFLEGQNILDELRRYPQTYEKIQRVKSQRENFLATECMVPTGSPAEMLQEALRAIRQTVQKEVLGISSGTAESVSWEAVSDWLIRCPLDFPDAGGKP